MRTTTGVPIPDVGTAYCDDGYDWISQLKNGWKVVPAWGSRGWDLGSWPLVVVAHYNGPESFGMAVYVEGDIEIHGFTAREDRDRGTDVQAVYWWRSLENGPTDLPPVGQPIPQHMRGPYAKHRLDSDNAAG